MSQPSKLDYSWHDLKVRAEDAKREAQRIVESTITLLAHSKKLLENDREPEKPVGAFYPFA